MSNRVEDVAIGVGCRGLDWTWSVEMEIVRWITKWKESKKEKKEVDLEDAVKKQRSHVICPRGESTNQPTKQTNKQTATVNIMIASRY